MQLSVFVSHGRNKHRSVIAYKNNDVGSQTWLRLTQSNLLCAAKELRTYAHRHAHDHKLNAQTGGLLEAYYCVNLSACVYTACACLCVVLGPGGGGSWVFMGRAGAYLLTAAVLAAFSSAYCCKSFHLTFHAEIKIAAKPGRKPMQRDETKACSVSSTLRDDSLKCRSLAGLEKVFFFIDAKWPV